MGLNIFLATLGQRQKGRKTERQKDRKTERQKDRKTERQKCERQKESQKLKKTKTRDRGFNIVMSGQFCTLVMSSLTDRQNRSFGGVR